MSIILTCVLFIIQSVLHENSYRNAVAKHCYADRVPDIQFPNWEDQSLVKHRFGRNCLTSGEFFVGFRKMLASAVNNREEWSC